MSVCLEEIPIRSLQDIREGYRTQTAVGTSMALCGGHVIDLS